MHKTTENIPRRDNSGPHQHHSRRTPFLPSGKSFESFIQIFRWFPSSLKLEWFVTADGKQTCGLGKQQETSVQKINRGQIKATLHIVLFQPLPSSCDHHGRMDFKWFSSGRKLRVSSVLNSVDFIQSWKIVQFTFFFSPPFTETHMFVNSRTNSSTLLPFSTHLLSKTITGTLHHMMSAWRNSISEIIS